MWFWELAIQHGMLSKRLKRDKANEHFELFWIKFFRVHVGYIIRPLTLPEYLRKIRKYRNTSRRWDFGSNCGRISVEWQNLTIVFTSKNLSDGTSLEAVEYFSNAFKSLIRDYLLESILTIVQCLNGIRFFRKTHPFIHFILFWRQGP